MLLPFGFSFFFFFFAVSFFSQIKISHIAYFVQCYQCFLHEYSKMHVQYPSIQTCTWKLKITNSSQYHKSHKQYQKESWANTNSWKHRRSDQVQRRRKHLMFTGSMLSKEVKYYLANVLGLFFLLSNQNFKNLFLYIHVHIFMCIFVVSFTLHRYQITRVNTNGYVYIER